MRTVYPTTVNNSNLIIVDPRIPLITNTLLAGYDCLTNQDFSGRNNHFTTSGAFTSQGFTLANNSSSIITTPVIEQDTMTIIAAWNVSANGVAASLVNNLDTSASTYKGVRLVKLASNGGQFDVATGNASPTLTSLATGVSGAWTTGAWGWRGGGGGGGGGGGSIANTLTLPSRVKNTARGFSVNGVPSGVSGGSITGGAVGTLGFLLFYNEYITPTDAAARMNTVASIMATRAVTIP